MIDFLYSVYCSVPSGPKLLSSSVKQSDNPLEVEVSMNMSSVSECCHLHCLGRQARPFPVLRRLSTTLNLSPDLQC